MSEFKICLIVSSFLLALTLSRSQPWIAEPRDWPWWHQVHEQFLNYSKVNKDTINVFFLGDSITHGWSGDGKETFDKYYAPLGTANYGIGSELTQTLLWRLQNNEVDNLHPKLCVLKIGTNNIGSPGSDIARGVAAVIDALRSRLPQMKVLLLGIIPRNNKGNTDAMANVNKMISILDNGKTIRFLDMGETFYIGDGVFREDLFKPDMLHLSPSGYAKWAEVMDPIFKQMLE